MELKFYKEEGKWYLDSPWDGDKSELEMVMGADVLLDELDCFNKESVVVQIVDSSTVTTIDLLIVESDEYGATYVVTTYNTQIRVSQIWLCTVTKHVFGGTFPENICFNVIN